MPLSRIPLSRLQDLLIAHEGLRKKPYDDQTGRALKRGTRLRGKLTIGVGRNLTDRGLSRTEIMILFDRDITIARSGAKVYQYFADLNEPRQAVCISMVFNCGVVGWSSFKRTHEALRLGDFEEASIELLDSQYATTVGDRALQLAEILRTGEWPS